MPAPRRLLLSATLVSSLAAGAALDACSAGGGSTLRDGAGAGTGDGGNVGGAGLFDPGSGGGGAGGGVIVDPCASECGPDELCESPHNGLDDDCDGTADENCPCSSGSVQPCFKGDPSYRSAPGCFPGSQYCTELGTWGECVGGVHAVTPDNCFQTQVGCHPLSAVPFATVDLADGIGNFGSDAVTESWSVVCPDGVSPCPAVGGSNPQDDFQPLQSGEYDVTYDKTTATGSDSCTYSLFVGAPGLRVELQWEHVADGTDLVDLDLHVHRPNSTAPWGGSNGNLNDCGYNNCTVDNYAFPISTGVEWFNGVAPPEPVAWSPPTSPENTTCYNAPRGVGQQWQNFAHGCHNPRLDLDNITCDPAVGDVDNDDFCAPENINIDYPPPNVWTRIGVFYYENNGNTAPVVHPVVKIFCDGRLAGEFGANYPTPVEWTGADASTAYWLVADVRPLGDPCNPAACDVVPLYADPQAQTPLVMTDTWVAANFGPPYPQ